MGQVKSRLRLVKALMLTSVAAATLALGAPVLAQDGPVLALQVPAQDLGVALTAVGDQAGVSIFFPSGIVAGRQSPALSGDYSVEQALVQLLAQTGLTYQFTSPTSVVISQPLADVDSDTLVLGPVRVVASSAAASAVEAAAERVQDTYRGVAASAHLSAEDIAAARGASPGDMLRGIAGVMNAENRNSGALDVNIRGLQGQGRSPVVLDGALQESTVYRGYSGMAGRTYIDPDLIGGLSIEKGPSMGADATGAVGGVVRARTLSPHDILAPDGTWALRLNAGLTGNNDTPPTATTVGGSEPAVRNYDRPDFLDLNGHNASAAFAYRTQTADFLAAYAQRENGNYYTGERGIPVSEWNGGAHPFENGEQVINSSIETTSYLLRGVFRPVYGHTFDLSYLRYEGLSAEMKPSQLMYGDTPYQTVTDVSVDTYTARYRYNTGNPLVDLRADLWATRVDSFNIDPVRLDYGSFQYNGDMFAATLSERWGATVHNTSVFEGAPGRLSLNYGFAYDHEDFGKSDDWERLNALYPGRSWDPVRTGWRDQTSAFINATYNPADWATFTLGARYIHNEVTDSNTGSSWVLGGISNHDAAEGIAPAFSALIEPVQGLQFYGRYAEALRAASPFEATEGFSGSVNPYWDLKMEHAHNTELGINVNRFAVFRPDDAFSAKLSWFNNEITDYITLGQERLTAPNGNSTEIQVRTNIPEVSMRGWELSARYAVGSSYLALGATEYTDISSCYRSTASQPISCYDGMPQTSASWFVNHIPPERTFSATVGTALMDERLNLGLRYNRVVRAPAYELFDLFGSYQINDRTSLSFAVDNLFDIYYVDALSLGEGVAVLPAPGRTLSLNFTTTLGDGTPERSSSAAVRNYMAAQADARSSAVQPFDGNWGGAYAGLTFGAARFAAEGETYAGDGSYNANAAIERTDTAASSAVAGLQFGYRKQQDSGLVLGVEASVDFARGRAQQYMIDETLDVDRWGENNTRAADYTHSWGATAMLRGSVGQTFGRAHLFATAGLGMMEEHQTRTQYRLVSGIVNYPSFSETDSQLRTGVVVGAGMDYAFSNALSLRGEYVYGYYPEKNFNFDRASNGTTAAGLLDQIGRQAGSELHTHALRIGLNYRF
ncbi:TonB-dependent heme/hemoglobin receptor family protein [Ketogulonicigenium vulgare Y25]|uniref:TonB-dependent heme/hemoglobin receptor family protein n=2 Tax=Ketogulonicigenium vulgare TaxID=92945 RepID=F9Y3Z7_KETVW|nr:TonB-dependent heme/hemoglobin receptor family protein [Ketogulonicigenium vulgare Y25]AEM41688.1 TonB-dependent heme/hemoglobin receptor family protein [Ketogulonicigenium vulgare WSH-001]ALJ81796.1 TonB-dependent receptor [Ketogulonicigenium vulgare]ANW34452.1 TonB-dependent receptor [Ketogulonicigenium vulgare]AOZ55438.1 TonB-dependent heme/hemoglobin receptor family protein [Ketogulonicigenium vulgare]